jgi:hypothetical protein
MEVEEVYEEINLDKLDDEELVQLELEDAIRPRKYVLSARSQKRFYWDVLIILFAI